MFPKTIIDELSDLLRNRPAGLLSDIDGTLSTIAARPADAMVDPITRKALRRLARQLEVVGVITGRSALDAERMLRLPELVYFGNHGMEWLENGTLTIVAEASPFVDSIADVLEAVRSRSADSGVLVENKGVSGSIHYRLAANPALEQERLLEIVTPLAHSAGLKLTHGRFVIELRPPVRTNKGTALAAVVEQYGLRSLAYLGDDLTDLDAMRTLEALREAGAIRGLSIGIVDGGSPPEIAQVADRTVVGVDGMRDVLSALAQRLSNPSSSSSDYSTSSG